MSFFNKLAETASQKDLLKGLVSTLNVVVERLLNTYTKEEVNESIQDLASETFVSDAVQAGTAHLASQDALQGAKDELQASIDAIEIPSIDHLASKEEVAGAVSGLASEVYVNEKIDEKISEIPDVDFTGMATEEFVMLEILKAETQDKAYDLEVFFTKTEVSGMIEPLASKEELANAVDVEDETIELFNSILDKLA